MNIHSWFDTYRILLASASPRRKNLIKELGFRYAILEGLDFDESYPENLQREEIALHLAKKKGDHIRQALANDEVLLTADTIVWIDGQVIGKPKDRADALNMLHTLSGKPHEVVTGVHLRTSSQEKTFYSLTHVFFRPLLPSEIEFYIDTYHPFDKAGSYGIQEWIGYVGIEKIEGSFYNVMGLPVEKLYVELMDILQMK